MPVIPVPLPSRRNLPPGLPPHGKIGGVKPLVLVATLLALSTIACGPLLTPAPSASPFAISTRPRPETTPTPVPGPAVAGPVGFPLDPNIRPWQAVDTPQGRRLMPPAADGPTVLQVTRNNFVRAANDMESNRYGWNCRVHAKYEGFPGVDWYLPDGTPAVATMDAKAELYVIYTGNSFDYYNVSKTLYLGLPPANVPLFPFKGESGGMGIFVSLFDGVLRAEYGHLDPKRTIAAVPDAAFFSPYSKTFDYDTRFNKPRGPNDGTLVASWPVKRGQVVGYVGNSGYSDVAHLHYQVITPDRAKKYCPSEEPLPFSGWLFRRPDGFPY
jgi:hypothetical protein